MRCLPIPFKAEMVRAVLDGSKTQTRRPLKVQPHSVAEVASGNHLFDYRTDLADYSRVVPMADLVKRCPYGQPGDGLWVREAWKAHTTFDHLPPRDIPQSHVWYMADDGYKAESRYRQGMFMPRWASRITLEVVSVRVERLQDISEADALAEGIDRPENMSAEEMKALDVWDGAERAYFNALNQPVNQYRRLWDQINGPDSWAANPWVWVVEFRRLP